MIRDEGGSVFAQPDVRELLTEEGGNKKHCSGPWNTWPSSLTIHSLARWVCSLTSNSFSALLSPTLPRNLTSSSGLLWVFTTGLHGKHPEGQCAQDVYPGCTESRVRLCSLTWQWSFHFLS